MSLQTNLQRGSGPVVLLHKGDNEGVNPEDVRLEHLHQALYRLLLQHQVRDHPGGVRRHWRRGSWSWGQTCKQCLTSLDSYIDTDSFRIIWKLDQDQSQGKLLHQQLPSTNVKCEESNIAHRSAWDWDSWLRFPAGTSRCWSWCWPPPRWLLAANWRRLSAEKSEIMAHFSLHMEPTTEEQ